MGLNVHGDRVEVFKFHDSGMESLIYETNDFLAECRKNGRIPDTIRFENDKRVRVFKFVITFEED